MKIFYVLYVHTLSVPELLNYKQRKEHQDDFKQNYDRIIRARIKYRYLLILVRIVEGQTYACQCTVNSTSSYIYYCLIFTFLNIAFRATEQNSQIFSLITMLPSVSKRIKNITERFQIFLRNLFFPSKIEIRALAVGSVGDLPIRLKNATDYEICVNIIQH